MKKWTNLVIFELDRVKYGFLLLIGMIAGLQIFGVFQERNAYLRTYQLFQKETHGNILDYLNEYGALQFRDVIYRTPYYFSISLGVFALLTYAFMIWYRDWLGKNSFSFRLLALPGSRMQVFYAKLAAILFMMFGLIAIQVLLLLAEEQIFKMLVPSELFQPTNLYQITSETIFAFILPPSLLDFFLHYSIGISLLSASYVMILLHLSYQWKGLVASAILIAAGVSLIFLTDKVGLWNYLFPKEILWLIFTAAIILFLLSIVGSRFLLEKKITV